MPALVLSQGNNPADVAGRFFTALQTESPSVAASVREGMPVLARAFAAERARGGLVEEAVQVELQALLLRNVDVRVDGCRMAAVQWARCVFPFDDLGR